MVEAKRRKCTEEKKGIGSLQGLGVGGERRRHDEGVWGWVGGKMGR